MTRARPTAMAMVGLLAACGSGEPRSGPPGDEAGPQAPIEPTRSPAPFTCHVEPDLTIPAGEAASCPDAPALGAPRELRVGVDWSLGYDPHVAVDGAGTIAHYATWGLGVGYWTGELSVLRPDGTLAGTAPRRRHVLVTAAERGFLALGDRGEVTIYDRAGAVSLESLIAWPGALAPIGARFGYGGFMAASPDGRGGAWLALLGARGDGGGVLWAAHVEQHGSVDGPPFAVAPFPAEALADAYAPAYALGAVAIGEDGGGRVLVTWEGGWAGCGEGSIAARWFLRDGTALGGVFRGGEGLPRLPAAWGSDSRLVALHDGSLALRRNDGAWARRFAGGTPAGGAVPAWLAARRGEEVTALPDARVLAFRRPSDLSGAGARVDLVGRAGEVCARLELPPEEARREGMGMAPAVGLDGTVVQHARTDEAPLTGWLRVWPGALR